MFELGALPYAADTLEPYISEQTMSFHYGKHHAAYVNNLNKMVADTPEAGKSLEEIITSAEHSSGLFNNAAQAWNHTFYWNSMTPGGNEAPSASLEAALHDSFGSVDAFRAEFTDAALCNFASGWTWLVAEGSQLKVVSTDDADNPLRQGQVPLVTIDIWEHAYYLDYQNMRGSYVKAFVENLFNWEFVSNNWDKAAS